MSELEKMKAPPPSYRKNLQLDIIDETPINPKQGGGITSSMAKNYITPDNKVNNNAVRNFESKIPRIQKSPAQMHVVSS